MKSVKGLLPSILILLVMVGTIYAGSSYVGHVETKNLHNLDHSACQNYVNSMSPGNKVYFSSEQEAVNAGFHRCDKCPSSPPAPQPEPRPTAVSIKSEDKIGSDNEITISGQLTYTSYWGSTLSLYSKTIVINRIEDNQAIATLTTDYIGNYYYSFVPNTTYNYQASFAADSSYLASVSPIITISPRVIPKVSVPKKKVRVASSFHKKKCKNKKFHAKHCKVSSKLKKHKKYKKLIKAAKVRHKKKCTKIILK